METSSTTTSDEAQNPTENPPVAQRNWVQFTDETERSSSPSEPVKSNASPEPESNSSAADTSANSKSPAVIEPSVEIVPPISTPTRPSTNHSSHNNKSNNNRVIHSSNSNHSIRETQLSNVDLRNTSSTPGGSNHSISVPTTTPARRNNTGFTNGDVIVSILPVNTKWPWITPASFRPELVPEELMVPGFTLTVEEYVHAMEILTSDLRFNAYTICYKRLLASWLTAAFFILLIILFSGIVGIGLFALGITWLIINAAAVFLCMYIKIKINQGLERCMAKANKLLIKHKLILGLDDRGRVSCHKVHLCFIYFDPTDCIKRLDQLLEGMDDRQRVQRHLDASDVEIVITGSQTTTRVPQKDKQRGERLFLRYVQRWAKDFLRSRLDWTVGEGGENPSAPRHLTSALCPCQYVEEYLKHKPVAQMENSCNWWLPCCPNPPQQQQSR